MLEVVVDGVITRTVVRVVICVDGAVEDRVLLMVVEETVELVLDLVEEGKVLLLCVELVVLEWLLSLSSPRLLTDELVVVLLLVELVVVESV